MSAAAAALAKSGRQRHARPPLDRLEGADMGEEALPTAIDEDVTAEAVPDVVEHEDAVIDIGDAAILLDGGADQPRQDLGAVAERRTEPAHEAAVAQHVLELEAMPRHEKLVHRIECVRRDHRRPLTCAPHLRPSSAPN